MTSNEDNEGNPLVQLAIYLISEFLDVAEAIGERCLNVTSDFPCSTVFLGDGTFSVSASTVDNQHYDMAYDATNVSYLRPVLEYIADDFTEVVISSTYHVKMESSQTDRLFTLDVSASFTRDLTTNSIDFDFAHTRSHHVTEADMSDALDRPQFTFLLGILGVAFLLALLTLRYIQSVSVFAREKAAREFRDSRSVFWEKVDPWALFALFSHVTNIVAGALYLTNGMDRAAAVPMTFVVMTVGSASHCLLLTRYLNGKSFSMLIVRVAAKMFVLMVQFLIGCLVLYAGYLILGLCVSAISTAISRIISREQPCCSPSCTGTHLRIGSTNPLIFLTSPESPGSSTGRYGSSSQWVSCTISPFQHLRRSLQEKSPTTRRRRRRSGSEIRELPSRCWTQNKMYTVSIH
jgi:hypothetical protein